MNKNCDYLLKTAGIKLPVIGLYDTADPSSFEPLVFPVEGRWACVFMFFKNWQKGESLYLKPDTYGCGGAGTHLLRQVTRSREDYVDFLYGEEGLKASEELMGKWVDKNKGYKSKYENLIIGPLRENQYDDLKTITFFVNPDQLSLFVIGAHYFQEPSDIPVVKAPFSSGCGMLITMFPDIEKPDAIIGATDIAMRKYLPPDILAFTVTKPLYEQLCSLDENSFLSKRFWKDLQKARNRK